MSRTTKTRTAAAGLAALSLLAVPAAAEAKTVKGLQDDPAILSDDPAVRQAFFADAKASRTKTVRVLIKQDPGMTSVPTDKIERVKRAATEGRRYGVKLLVGSYVRFGEGKRAGAKVSSKVQSSYVLFMGDIASQLRSLPLAGYLTFNEPNYRIAWPTRQERAWVKLSNRVYKQIKKNDPGSKVLVGEASPNTRSGDASANPGAFFRKALSLDSNFRKAGSATKLLGDGFTLHTYDFVRSPTKTTANKDAWTHGNLKTTVQQIKRLARSGRLSGTAARNIHITEFAYRTRGSLKTHETRAASYLKSAFASAKRNGIKTFIWYQLRDPAGNAFWESGLKETDGTPYKTWNVFRKLK